MLKRITTAYGIEALEALRRLVSDAKRDDPMAPVLVLAPNQVAATVARRYLARHGLAGGSSDDLPSGIAGIDVTVIAQLAERLAGADLVPRRRATRPVLAAAWRRALRVNPGLFADVAEHPSTVRALIAVHRELRDLSGIDLDVVAAGSPVSADVVRLHREVVAVLAGQWYDGRDLLDAAAARLHVTGLESTVVLYLPQDLTVAERDVVKALGVAGDVVVLEGTSGVQRADERVRRWSPTDGLEEASAIHVPTATRVLNASDSDDEVRCVVRDVVRALQTAPADRVTVLYGAADPYARLLHEHFAAAGIRVNGPDPRPVLDRSLPRTLLGLLALADADVPRSALFRALADAPVRDFDGHRIPVSRWERVSRDAGVVRGKDWATRLDRYVAREQGEAVSAHEEGREQTQAAALRHEEAGSSLQTFVARLREELDHATTILTWTELSAWGLQLFETLLGAGEDLARLPVEEQYAAAAITSVFNGLDVLDIIESPASLTALREVLESELSGTVPRVGRFGDGVFVAPISQAVGLDADVVHVVGLSEDLYPGRARSDALVPDRVRATVDALPTSRDDLNRAYRHLLAAFAAAPSVTASFPRGDLRSSSRRLPSRWLLGTFRELSGDKRLAATQWNTLGSLHGALVTSGSFAGELLKTSDLATEQEWRTRQAAFDRLDDPAVDAAHELLRARAGDALTRFDGDLSGVEGLPDFRDGALLVSPTALESYAQCPHSFLVSRLLGVDPLEQPEDLITISSADVGTLIHASMERLVRECGDELPGPGQPWPAALRVRLIEIARELAAEAETSGLTGHPRLWRRERERIEADLVAMLDRDNIWRAQVSAKVVASEMPFGNDVEPPVAVPVPGGAVLMRGSADKVDVGTDGTVYVTDIKTGSRTSYKAITPDDPLGGGAKLQLPVYGMAARDRFGDPTTVVRAGYWFVRKEPGRIEIEVTGVVEQALSTTVDILASSIATGLFPQRPPEKPDLSWVQCHYCNPDGVGHATNRERWERQRHDPKLRQLVSLLEPGVLTQNTEDLA